MSKEMTKAEFNKRESELLEEIEEAKKYINDLHDRHYDLCNFINYINFNILCTDFDEKNITDRFIQATDELKDILMAKRECLCELRGE